MIQQANFSYAAVNDRATVPLDLAIFADRGHLRVQLAEDACAAGFLITTSGDLDSLLAGDTGRGCGMVMVDCPRVDARMLAALSQLDLRAARGGQALIVSTTVAALEDVFGCLDQSNPQILIDPSRADRVVALGLAMAQLSGARLRDLTEEDRLTLLRLTEQVGQIAQRLDQLVAPANAGDADRPVSAFRFETPASAYSAPEEDSSERLVRAARPALPDPRLIRRIIRQRQLRARYFDGELFADPAWDMLLDLTAARAEHTRVSVTSLCIASSVSPTTALRWIGQMTDCGLLQRVEDEADRRRAFITLTDKAADAMSRFFAELGTASSRLV